MRSIHIMGEPPFVICIYAFYYIICRNIVQYAKQLLTKSGEVRYTYQVISKGKEGNK